MMNMSLEMYGCDFHPVSIILWDNPHKVKASYFFSPLLLNDEWEAMGAAETAISWCKRADGVGGTKGPWTQPPRLERQGSVRNEECDTL